jgi:hypothetical protein
MSRRSAYRCWAHASALGVAVVSGVLFLVAGPATASTTHPSLKVSPDRGLVNGQVVTVSGRGLSRSAPGSGLTWFITQCTAAVHERVNPATDTPHCDVTDAKAIKVSRDGTFSTKFRIRAGIVGDGYCGTAGHSGCVIGVSNAKGQGTVVKVTFAGPHTATTSTSSSTSTTAA